MKGKKIRPGKKIIVVGCHQEGTPTGQYKCNPEPSFWRYSGHVKQVLQTWNKETNMQPVRISKGL